ncbi:hypothetical protein P5V15_002528 [Pogonomyrmex californicus]
MSRRQRYIEFCLGQVSEEMGEDAPRLELSPGERERSTSHRGCIRDVAGEFVPNMSVVAGPGNVLAHAFLASFEVSEVHVDNAEKWHIELTANPNATIHLLHTLTHEIGALELYHSPQKNSIIRYSLHGRISELRAGTGLAEETEGYESSS